MRMKIILCGGFAPHNANLTLRVPQVPWVNPHMKQCRGPHNWKILEVVEKVNHFLLAGPCGG